MTHDNQPNKSSNWEKIAAICLATIVLCTFILYVFNPPPTADGTLALIRFLAAFLAGLAAFLFVGNLNLEGSIPGLNDKVKVKAAGGFAAFLIVFFLFYYQVKPEGNSKQPDMQPITIWGSYPTLALFDPEHPVTPEILVDELDIDKTPLVFQLSPVFESIQKFIFESGNRDFISLIDSSPYARVVNSINHNTKTNSSFLGNNNVTQTQSEFEQDSLIIESHGAHSAIYNPILMEFFDDEEEAAWTVAYDRNIYQYPKLSDIGKSKLALSERGQTWIRNVINANPELRGLIGYSYPYITDLQDGWLGCVIPSPVSIKLLLPYVKFIDISNPHEEAIQLNSIIYQIAFEDENPYILRDSTKRSILLKNASTKKANLNFILQPRRHLLIPIEFGFQLSKNERGTNPIRGFSSNVIYLLSPESESINGNLLDVDESKNIQTFNKTVIEEIRLSDNFLKNVKYSLSELNIPAKIAIGSVLNTKALIVDGRKISIPQPADSFSASIAQMIGVGSCPYLLIYNPNKGYWIDLGTVLFGRSSKDLQNIEIYGIGSDSSKIKLQERENEVTYLDYLAIVYDEPDTEITREVVPNIPKIDKPDNRYLVLNKGEELEINVEELVPENARNIRVKIEGYYERI